MASYLSSYTLLLVIFNIFVTSKLSTGTRNHAYFSTNEDSQYIGDNIPVTLHKDFTGTSGKISIDESLFNSRIHLKFLPTILDFKERHLGIPHHERVTIINLSCNRTILMSSISGSTVHFHSSFFHDKIIPPLGNTSFSVVFLGRSEGEIKSYLYIHTSEGSFKYQVRGEIVGSPYRIRSLSGIKLPLNATYTPELFMHNPHPTVLQILEVYSSGHEFHLELPSGDLGGPKHIWQIPAFFTKPIIRLKFFATSHKNHSAYLRLKLDYGEQILMIPVDVEVGSACGLYSSDDLINFGFGGTRDSPKKMKLFLKNSSKKPVKVLSVSTFPLSKAIKIDFKPTVIPPKSKSHTEVAVLTLDWETVHKTGLTSGNIIVKSNQYNQKLILRYYASVLEGGLEHDSSQVKFKSDESDIPPRLLNLKNNFKVPVVITGVSLRQSAAPYFQVTNFTSTSILPGETKAIFYLEAKNNFLKSNLMIESGIHISTNASALVVPLLCFNGKLKMISTWETNDTFLNFGSVPVGDQKLFYFGLINENPIEIHIKTLKINISDAIIGIVAVERGNATRAMHAIAAEYNIDTRKEIYLAPRSFCVVQVSIPGKNIGYVHGKVSVVTNFETLIINTKLKVKNGNDLDVFNHRNKLGNCFQNEFCETEMIVESLSAVSLFDSNHKIKGEQLIGLLPSPYLLPFSKAFLHFCGWNINESSCFTVLSNNTGLKILSPCYSTPEEIQEVLLKIEKKRLVRVNFGEDLSHSEKLIIEEDIPESEESVFEDNTEDIPTNNSGTFGTLRGSYKFLSPLDLPLISQQMDVNFFILHYESYLKLTSELMKVTYLTNISGIGNLSFKGLIKPEWPPKLAMIESKLVNFPSSGMFNTSYQDIMITNLPPIQTSFLQLILEPSFSATDSVHPSNTSKDLNSKQISNRDQLKIGSRKSGSYTTLLFELTDKHLRTCERIYEANNKPFLIVRRSFFAKNTGLTPLSVIGFVINGHPCEAFGFHVINCEPFILPANASKKIDIAFTPDFTLSKVSRLLTVLTLDASVNYTLIATLPPYLLSACSNNVKRPSWEPLVYYSSVSFMLFLLICVLGAAFFESNRILRNTIITLSRDNNLQPVLDLRMIGSEALNSSEQSSVHRESEYKIIWTSNAYSEEQVTKDTQKPISESIFTINCSNKCQILNNGINCKKKSERTICKRFADGTENYIEKTCWETSYSRTNSSQPMKTSICITTEPYIPLTNIKTRDPPTQKSEFSGSKYEQPRFIEFQRRRSKKKNQSINNYDLPKKKQSGMASSQNIFEESESSAASSESSCSEDGEKDVESMFFQSVRHHLESKVTRGRHVKVTSSSPLIKRKKSIEKSSVNTIDNDWDIDEDETTEKATVVRNNRRSTSSVKQVKKQTVNYGKMRFEQSQARGRPNFGERALKCCVRKEKTQTAKKRTERMEKRVSAAKATTTIVVSQDLIPAIPSPPVWTASFSDVVAGTDSTYSSVVATKSNSSTQNQKHQLSICVQDKQLIPEEFEFNSRKKSNDLTINYGDSGSSCSGSSVTNFSSGWKAEYQDALEQQETTNEQAPPENNHPLNSIWSNWSSISESMQQSGSSANSLFTDGSPQNNGYEPLWNDQNAMSPQEIDNFHGARNEINWPIITSLWEPLYTPSSSTVETPPPVWGSEVWGPPTTNQSSTEDVVQGNLEYDPFRSLSNIWAQHSSNIWKPPATE